MMGQFVLGVLAATINRVDIHVFKPQETNFIKWNYGFNFTYT